MSLSSLALLDEALAAVRAGRITIDSFCRTCRQQSALLAALPARYGQVLEDLLQRLEAGSLFTEESCSFSQQGLYAGLVAWLDKARQAQRQ